MTQPRNDPLAPLERPTTVTGRKAPVPKRKKPGAYHLATEMRLVHHPYREQGIGAQPGIEL